MAQIFVSHSRKDKDSRGFVSVAAARTSMKLVLMEFEGDPATVRTSHEIEEEIESAAALFILLSKHVECIPHTRDWVMWESGCAKGKDIWVFEDAGAEPTRVVVPSFTHYVLYHRTDSWISYATRIVNSYLYLDTLEATVLGATLGGTVAGPAGALLGGAAAAAVSSLRNRPSGHEFRCANCGHTAAVHYPIGLTSFRCVVCNAQLRLPD